MLIFFYFSNFHRVPPRPLEISGRQNWANVSNLAHFAQKATKKQQMLKNDVFWDFWRFEIFENFWPTIPKFQNLAPGRRNFCRPQNLGNHEFRSQRVFRYACAYFLITISRYNEFYVNFHQKILVIFYPTRSPFDPIGAFLGVGRNFWHKKNFFPSWY